MQVYIPHSMQLLHNGQLLQLKPGRQTIPAELATHWWLLANGVVAIRPM